jgi:hypothetical protein
MSITDSQPARVPLVALWMSESIDEWLVNLLEWKFTTTEPAMAISPDLSTRLPFDRVVSVKVPASLFRFGLICPLCDEIPVRFLEECTPE